MSGAENLLRVARAEIGKRESPAGSNRTPYGQWFGMNGVPWCDIFVSWCAAQAGLGAVVPKSSFVPARFTAATRARQIVHTPQPGDLACFDWGGDGTPDHIGIVVSLLSNGDFVTIEGNTSPSDRGSQSNGGMVCSRTRRLAHVAGFIRPAYPVETDMPLNADDLAAVAKATMGAEARFKVRGVGDELMSPVDALGRLLRAVDGLNDRLAALEQRSGSQAVTR